MRIRGRYRNCVYQAAECIHTNMAFHSETPFIALFRLVHLRIARFPRVLGRRGGVDDRRVYYRTALQHMPAFNHNPVDGIEKHLVQSVLF